MGYWGHVEGIFDKSEEGIGRSDRYAGADAESGVAGLFEGGVNGEVVSVFDPETEDKGTEDEEARRTHGEGGSVQWDGES